MIFGLRNFIVMQYLAMQHRKAYISIYIYFLMVKKIDLEKGKLSIMDDIELVFEKVVTKFGTGAKADVPKKYIGRKVYVLVQK